MKYLKFLVVVLLSFTLLACKGEEGPSGPSGTTGTSGEDGNDGKDATPDIVVPDDQDPTTDIVTRYSLSGKLQKGPCFKDGDVVIQPLDANMDQTGEHFVGSTKDDFGRYEIPAEITGDLTADVYAEVFFDGDCHNEITGGTGVQKLSGIINVADSVNNINPLTKIRSPVARYLFDSGFGNRNDSLIEAERMILFYLGMPSLDKKFTEMNLEQAGIHDAVLALSNSMILYGRTEAEQGAYMVSIANGVIANDLTLKAEIATTIDALPLIQIKNNLESRYFELGMNVSVPPIWTLGAPDYYNDLLTRTPTVTGTFNLDDNSNCNFDLNTFNTFAIPHVFDATNDIESAKYIALNLDHEVSIWSSGTHVNGHLAPNTKLLDITKLKEVILTNPKTMNYNGLLGNHGLTNGTDYYIVTRSDTDFTLSTSCEGGLLPYGRKLASQDEGQSWIGWDNNTPFFRKSGMKMYTTD